MRNRKLLPLSAKIIVGNDMQLLTHARQIFKQALSAVDPYQAVVDNLIIENNKIRLKQELVSIDLTKVNNIYVVGAGKVLEKILNQLTGLISVKYKHGLAFKKIRIIEAGHPLPDVNSRKAVQEILKVLSITQENDLVISLISGGGSALLALPVTGVSLEQKILVTQKLLACGASIDEINTVRKHISLVKGGQLARAAYPAPVFNLLLSDVLDDRVDIIASGLMVADKSTFQDAIRLVEKYKLSWELPEAVTIHLKKGVNGLIPETPKQGDPIFNKVYTCIVGSNRIALNAARSKARELGYNTLLLSSTIQGEAREIGKTLAAIAREIVTSGNPLAAPGCIICGGETTVTLQGQGKGGRNQECALSALTGISGLPATIIFCAGTDGTDGPTDAAGAYCTGDSQKNARAQGLNEESYLRENDSYNFFKKLGSLIITNPTGTNVMDIYMILVGK
jgi:glycerate 2-kinase